VWNYSTPIGEVVVRVAVVYLALLLMIRLAGKRELGELGPMDLLAMLLLSETVSPALTGGDASLTVSLTAAATLLGLTVAVGRITFHSRRMERWIDGPPVVLARDGKVFDAALRRERITDAGLREAMRKNGVDDLAEVALAVAEQDGKISIVRRR
jgi:uncharacterized membrane protein YcaP (DUF421 family)